MMRKLFLLVAMAGLIGAGGFAGVAQANPTITLVPKSSTTILVGGTVTFDVILNNDSSLIAGLLNVEILNTAIVNVQSALNTSPAGLSGAPFSSGAPLGPTGSFGGLNLAGSLAPGTYDMGDITYVGVAPGSTQIHSFVPLAQDWYDVYFTQVNPADAFASITVNVVPEPATASMLALGLLGLVMAGRRSRA